VLACAYSITYRVISAPRKRVAPEYPPCRQHNPANKPLFLYCLPRIFAARWIIPAAPLWIPGKVLYSQTYDGYQLFKIGSCFFHSKNVRSIPCALMTTPARGANTTSVPCVGICRAVRNISLNILLIRFRTTAFPIRRDTKTAMRHSLKSLAIQWMEYSGHFQQEPRRSARLMSPFLPKRAFFGSESVKKRKSLIGCFRNGEFLAAFFPSVRKNFSSAFGCHSVAKAVFVYSFALRRLECSFHL
jgi:hypothetical protein